MEMGCLNIMQNRSDNRIYAGFFVRLAAYLTDIIIVWCAMLVIRIPVWVTSVTSPNNFFVRDFIFQYSIKDILFYLMQAAYFILLTYFTGSTLGKKIFQIRVVSAEERKMTFFEVAFRETVGRFLSALILSIGYIMIAVDKQKRGLHDILSDTNVVYYHEKKVYIHADIHYKNMVGNEGKNISLQQQNPYNSGEAQSNPYNAEKTQPNSYNVDGRRQNSYETSNMQQSSYDATKSQTGTEQLNHMPDGYFEKVDSENENTEIN